MNESMISLFNVRLTQNDMMSFSSYNSILFLFDEVYQDEGGDD